MTTDSRTPPDLAYLRDKCWHGDPLERLTFHDVLNKLGEMMAVSSIQSGRPAMELPLPDQSSEGHYSDQFSTAPVEAISHLWDRRCRRLSKLLLQKPQVEQLLQRRVRSPSSLSLWLSFYPLWCCRSCSLILTLGMFQMSLQRQQFHWSHKRNPSQSHNS